MSGSLIGAPVVILGEFDKAAGLCPKILGINAKHWEDWVFYFADKAHIKVSSLQHSGFHLPFIRLG